MSRVKTLQNLFRRHRRPGDIVFAWFVFLLSAFLILHIADQTAWKSGSKLFAQPRFWPGVSLGCMTLFAGFHLLGSAFSERIQGRWQEIWLWVSALEYAAWFIAYASILPYTGYMTTTIVFAVALCFRAGYRSRGMLIAAALSALAIVLLFKTLLQINLPSGLIYESLPDGLRQIIWPDL